MVIDPEAMAAQLRYYYPHTSQEQRLACGQEIAQVSGLYCWPPEKIVKRIIKKHLGDKK